MDTRRVWYLLLIFIVVYWSQAQEACVKPLTGYRLIRKKRVLAAQCRPKPIFADFFKDIVLLNGYLWSVDSYKIFTSIFPLYVGARMLDRTIQSNFYCRNHHKNKNQMPWWCNSVARFGLSLPLVGLGSLAFFSSNEELRQMSWAFILGMPFLIFGNKITKAFTFNGCYRPWCEDFSLTKRSGGGFPSGHMAEITYMTALYGSRFGPSWGIPLGIYGAFVGTNFLISNRHYLSQLIGGIGWGLMYAYAANKLVDSKLNFSLTCDSNGAPSASISYSW